MWLKIWTLFYNFTPTEEGWDDKIPLNSYSSLLSVLLKDLSKHTDQEHIVWTKAHIFFFFLLRLGLVISCIPAYSIEILHNQHHQLVHSFVSHILQEQNVLLFLFFRHSVSDHSHRVQCSAGAPAIVLHLRKMHYISMLL